MERRSLTCQYEDGSARLMERGIDIDTNSYEQYRG